LHELAFDVSDKLFAMVVNFVLGVKQRAPSDVTVGLKRFNVFLGLEFFLECWRGRGGAACFPDLPVEFLDLALQPNFQILGPAVELIGFRFEEGRVPLGDRL
jgi:hypothetical protein